MRIAKSELAKATGRRPSEAARQAAPVKSLARLRGRNIKPTHASLSCRNMYRPNAIAPTMPMPHRRTSTHAEHSNACRHAEWTRSAQGHRSESCVQQGNMHVQQSTPTPCCQAQIDHSHVRLRQWTHNNLRITPDTNSRSAQTFRTCTHAVARTHVQHSRQLSMPRGCANAPAAPLGVFVLCRW